MGKTKELRIGLIGTGLMGRIADEAGVTLAPPLLTDALSAPGGPGATYEEMIRYNVTTIVEALR